MEIEKRSSVVAVIGLGYVGLPLAVLSAIKGYSTLGIDIDPKKIEDTNAGKNYLDDEFLDKHLTAELVKATDNATVIQKADIVIVAVPTPVDAQFNPDLGPVRSACKSIIENIEGNPLVIIESTINPGVCEEVIMPMFSEAGLEAGKDYEIAHCPERINPGDPKWNVTNIPRVVGSTSPQGLERALTFYRSILDAKVTPMKSIREAEAAKVVENSFRDINIAFVNELAKSFDRMGIDVVDVIKGAATKPFAFMPHWPGCGVGGHCIPVDPYYLIERAKQSGFDHKFLRSARTVNNSMPEYTVELLQDKLNDLKMPLNGTKIGVLGIAYKANVGDVRESPAIVIIEHLKKHKAEVLTYDPHLLKNSTENSLEDILNKSDALILVTNHTEFVEMNMELLKKYDIRVIIDGKNCLDSEKIKSLGIVYKGIGRE